MKIKSLLVSLTVILLLISLYFNWSYFRLRNNYKSDAKMNFILGVSIIENARISIKDGKKETAKESVFKGLGYLDASSNSMEKQGIKKVTGLRSFLDHAMPYLLENVNTDDVRASHYQHVLDVMDEEFTPFKTLQYGSIDDKKLKQAVDKVYRSMTPQERTMYENNNAAY